MCDNGTKNPAGKTYDDSTWSHCTALLSLFPLVRLHYISVAPPPTNPQLGTVLLIHGFPQTSYQYRFVITPLSKAGYHVIAPDYRGAGASSHPPTGYSKSELATDLHTLLYKHAKVTGKVHVVGQDIGGMIAHAFAVRYPRDTASVAIGECPLPGTLPYENTKHSPLMFHFSFQQVPDLPEMLIQGNERIYLKHFFDRAAYNPNAITKEDLDVYADDYSQPGAMRCGFELYRTFEEDAVHNMEMVKTSGKSRVPAMALVGDCSFSKDYGKGMLEEVYGSNVEWGRVKNSGHWTSEENPDCFIELVLGFVSKHNSGKKVKS